ncbi:hypothetical protein JCM17960_16820 [Magnetospira thiophila]
MDARLPTTNTPSFLNFSNWLMSETDVEADDLIESRTIEIDEENWSGETSTHFINNDIQFLVLKSEIKNDFELTFPNERTPGYFSNFYVECGEPMLNFIGSAPTRYTPHLGVMYCPDAGTHDGQYKGGSAINVLDVKAPLDLIDATLEGPSSPEIQAMMAEDFSQQPLQKFRINQEMHHLIRSAVHSELQGTLRTLQLEGIAIQLLALQLHAVNETSVSVNCTSKLTQKDRGKIEEVREFLLSDLRSPPSLSEMAQSVGLSEKKLTLGFKALYHMTPFELLKSQRLEVARQALNEDVPLKQISHRVGYRHVTNFIKAFTKHFGKPPRQYDLR